MRINHFFLLIMLVITGCDCVHAHNKKVPGVIVNHIAQTEEKIHWFAFHLYTSRWHISCFAR